MLRLRHDLKIAWFIVGFIMINVVNNFSGQKRATKQFDVCGDRDVFCIRSLHHQIFFVVYRRCSFSHGEIALQKRKILCDDRVKICILFFLRIRKRKSLFFAVLLFVVGNVESTFLLPIFS